LLHRRIDPTIDIVCRPPSKPKIKIRSAQHTQNKTEAKILKNAPIWTLSREALQHLKWENKIIPIYDPTDEEGDDDDNDNNEEVGTSSRKRKRKEKGKEKERKNKK
jgi:hypothetical protein